MFLLLISTEVLRELTNAPDVVRNAFDQVSSEHIEMVSVNSEVEALADAYVLAGVIGQASRADAIHVAAATVAVADMILSWNFKHIVNFNRIGKYNAVNVLNGYKAIEIRSPAEVVYDDNDKDL